MLASAQLVRDSKNENIISEYLGIKVCLYKGIDVKNIWLTNYHAINFGNRALM